MFTLVGGQVFSSMCQHGMRKEGHWRPFFCLVRILQGEGVKGGTTSPCNLYYETSCCSR